MAYNAGVVKWQGRYIMAYRREWRDEQRQFQSIMHWAFSDDGVHFEPHDRPLQIIDYSTENTRAYDPRLTVIDNKLYMCFAIDTAHGIRGGVAVTDGDLWDDWRILGVSAPDNRNMVLFPERINDRLARLERPFPMYGRYGKQPIEAFDCWYSDSADGADWGGHELVIGWDHVPWVNNKLGPAAPPIKTDRGWLTTFHGVIKDDDNPLPNDDVAPRTKQYLAGLMLLDLEQPWKVVGLCRDPLLVPNTDYEKIGYRGHVIFPGGMLLEPDGQVKIYYGAADTVECLATAQLNDLLTLCEPCHIDIPRLS
ncbi:MAG: glycoside hydrolase family 130 protein [Planctomycetota bacterium]